MRIRHGAATAILARQEARYLTLFSRTTCIHYSNSNIFSKTMTMNRTTSCLQFRLRIVSDPATRPLRHLNRILKPLM